MPAPELKQFDDRTQLVEQLTAAIVSQLGSAIAQRGQALLAVSGGNTPIPLFECLSHQTIEWEKVTITLVDERWVNDTHSDSNAKLAKDYLLKNNASVSKFIPLYNGMASPFGAKSEVNQALTELHLPFDAVILGMGDDGHTASFFPHA